MIHISYSYAKKPGARERIHINADTSNEPNSTEPSEGEHEPGAK
jgi:hypothetical protein